MGEFLAPIFAEDEPEAEPEPDAIRRHDDDAKIRSAFVAAFEKCTTQGGRAFLDGVYAY